MDWENNYQQSASHWIKIIEKCAPGIDYQHKRILDVGCWWGWFIRYAREKGGTLFGVDYDLEKLKDAFAFIGREGLLISDAQALPFADNTFDIVFSWHVMEHLMQPELMLQHIHRILKKDGQLIIAVPSDLSLAVLPYRPIRFLLNKKEKVLKEKGQYQKFKSLAYSDTAHLREYTLKSFSNIIERNSFEIINALSYGCELPYPLRGRLTRKQSLFVHKILGPLTFPPFRSAHIVYARKKGERS